MNQEQFFSCSSSLKASQMDRGSLQESGEEKSSYQGRQMLATNIKELYESRDRLREFAHKIGLQINNRIRDDVIRHCNKIKMNWNQNLSYEKIQKMTKNRIEKMIKNKRIKKNWSEEDVLIFIWVVSKYSDFKGADNVERDLNHRDWEDISRLIPGVEAESCMFKWLGLKKSNLSDNCWSDRQSSLLEKIVKKYGDNDWSLIAQKLYYANTSSFKIYRCPKQCRQHWNCYLNPKLKKGPWSREEDILLLSSVMRNNGQKRWAEIVKDFDGRTQNALKNRYTLIIDKELRNMSQNNEQIQLSELDIIKQYLQRTYVEQFMNIQNQFQMSDNKSVKIKQKKIRRANSCIQNAKRPVRTSLRRRVSQKEKCFGQSPEHHLIMNYCDLIKPKLEPQSSNCQTPEAPKVYNYRNKLFSFQNEEKEQRKTRRGRRPTQKLKRWNTISNLQQIYESQQANIKIEQFSQQQQNNCLLPFQQICLKEEMPLYQQESNSNFARSFHRIYDDDDEFLVNAFNMIQKKQKQEDKMKSENCKLEEQNHNLFQCFNDQNFYHNRNYHESSFNFNSFEHFALNDFQSYNKQPVLHTTQKQTHNNNQQTDKQKQLHQTWDYLPVKLQGPYY